MMGFSGTCNRPSKSVIIEPCVTLLIPPSVRTFMKPTLEEEYPLDLTMDGEVRWTADEGYVGTTSGGKVFGIYGESSPSPMEMVLHSHAACSLIDVSVGLKERASDIDAATVKIESVRADESPRVFTSINMRYIVKGDVPEKLVRRLIESSHEKYCSVGIMITRSGASLGWSLELEA